MEPVPNESSFKRDNALYPNARDSILVNGTFLRLPTAVMEYIAEGIIATGNSIKEGVLHAKEKAVNKSDYDMSKISGGVHLDPLLMENVVLSKLFQRAGPIINREKDINDLIKHSQCIR